MNWWQNLDTLVILEMVKRLEGANVPWYNVRAAVYQFVTSHQTIEFTKSVLEWLK